MRKLPKLLSLIAILFFSSCTSINGIKSGELKKMEKKDHKECLFITNTKDFAKANELYWRCRVKAVNRRLYNAENTRKHPQYQQDLKDARQILKNRIIQAQNENTAKTYKDIDKKGHRICIIRYSESKNFSDEYNNCRKWFIKNRTNVEPFGKKSYQISEYDVNNPEVLKDIIEKNGLSDKKRVLTLEEKAEEISKLLLLFPDCKKYKIESDKFNECIKLNREAQECTQNIPSKIEQRKLDDKMFCKKKSIKEVPDDLAIYDFNQEKKQVEKKEKITEERKEKETKKDDGLSGLLGITAEGKKAFKKKEKEKKEVKEPAVAPSLHFGPKLSKTRIMELREKSYKKCMKNRRKKLKEYKKYLPKKCSEIKEIEKEENL